MSAINSTSETVETVQQWARRLPQGDPEAYRLLYETYGPQVLAYLTPRCLGRLSAVDVFQEAWLRVWAKRSTFDGENFRAWLFQIAHRCLINAYRKKQPDLPGDGFDVAGPVSESEKEEIAGLEDCLERVGGEAAAILRAHFYENESYASIAERFEIAVGTVASRLNRAKSKVRECMEKKFPE